MTNTVEPITDEERENVIRFVDDPDISSRPLVPARKVKATVLSYEARLSATEEERKRLREALEPFKDAAITLDVADYNDCPDDEHIVDDGAYGTLSREQSLTFGHFRAARNALSKEKNDG